MHNPNEPFCFFYDDEDDITFTESISPSDAVSRILADIEEVLNEPEPMTAFAALQEVG